MSTRSASLNGNELDGMTLEAVAKVLGVTRERVRQIEAKALRKLRLPECSKHLKRFLQGSVPDHLTCKGRVKPCKSLSQVEENIPRFWRQVL